MPRHDAFLIAAATDADWQAMLSALCDVDRLAALIEALVDVEEDRAMQEAAERRVQEVARPQLLEELEETYRLQLKARR